MAHRLLPDTVSSGRKARGSTHDDRSLNSHADKSCTHYLIGLLHAVSSLTRSSMTAKSAPRLVQAGDVRVVEGGRRDQKDLRGSVDLLCEPLANRSHDSAAS